MSRKRKNYKDSGIYRINSLDDFIVHDDNNLKKPRYQRVKKRSWAELDDVEVEVEVDVDEENIWNIKDEELDDEEFIKIREEMENEVPTVTKIMKANITKNDKKKCLRLLEQMESVELSSEDYFRFMDEINIILRKESFYTKKEIEFLEKEEEKLRIMFYTADDLKTKILKLEASQEIKSKLLCQYEQMMTYPTDSTNYSNLKEEIEWSIKLPYDKREVDSYFSMNNSELNEFYYNVRKKLDEELYGMDKVKDKIIQILNDRRTSNDTCGRSIALVGNPGVGKTAIGKALSKVLDKKFAKISAATLDSVAIKGSNKVWQGSEPSIILQTLAELKTNNPILMIDEVDKVDLKCQYALLHLSDSSDNNEFQDHYLKNIPHDLSKIMITYNCNSTEGLHPAFLDRLDIIRVDDYTNEEKVHIFQKYMLPKIASVVGFEKTDIIICDKAVKKLFKEKSKMTLRDAEKTIKEIVGKINLYKSVILPDGTTGKIKLDYVIPKFKLPIKIDYNLMKKLL
jgi:ATP-dependent Lon protease